MMQPGRAQSRHSTPTARDYAAAFDKLQAIGGGCPSPAEFARRGVALLPRLVASAAMRPSRTRSAANDGDRVT
jgi:hypothetical protein